MISEGKGRSPLRKLATSRPRRLKSREDVSHWVPSNKYLFAVKVMGQLLQGKMMAALRDLHAKGPFATFKDSAGSSTSATMPSPFAPRTARPRPWHR